MSNLTVTQIHALALALVLQLTASPTPLQRTVVQKYFTVSVPSSATVAPAKSTPSDFDLFEVRDAASVLVVIYVGNAPTFPAHKNNNVVAEHLRGAVREKEARGRPGADVDERLFALNSGGWPTYLHAFVVSRLKNERLRLARKILDTVSIRGARFTKKSDRDPIVADVQMRPS